MKPAGQRLPQMIVLAGLVLGSTGCPDRDKGSIPSFSRRTQFLQGEQTISPAGTAGVLKHVHLWTIGDAANVTRIYFLNHGDGNNDYSSATAADRSTMEALLPPQQGALVAYLVSAKSNWPSFSGGQNGRVLLEPEN